MRLTPIERPPNPLLRLAYRLSVRQFGKVISPLKMLYARKPRLLFLATHIQRTLEHGVSLKPKLRLLIQAQVARLNGCTFCKDLVLAQAVSAKIGAERFAALAEFRTSEAFTEQECAVLAFAEEATLHRRVSDETFAALRAHFSETEIVEIAWVNAAENYFNLQAAPLGIESDELLALAAAQGK